jgi:hypothetical protein
MKIIDALALPCGRSRLHHINGASRDEEDEGANHVDNEAGEDEDRSEDEGRHGAAVLPVLEGHHATAQSRKRLQITPGAMINGL